MPRLGLRAPRSLASRVFLGGSIVVVAVLALVFVILSRWAERSGEAVVQRELEQSLDLVAQFLAGRQRGLTGGARVFVQAPYFRAIVAENRRDDIIDQTFEAVSQLDADWVFIVDERGILLAKSDEPSASGADLGGVPLIAGALQGRVTSGFGVSRD
jgi:sensor domain CHASE-containing protein